MKWVDLMLSVLTTHTKKGTQGNLDQMDMSVALIVTMVSQMFV